jgi:hypothetical protein
MSELERKRQQLLKSLHQAIDLILSNGDATYILCVRLRDGETQKVMNNLLSNLNYRNSDGTLVPATPGMLMDIILEAMLDNPDFCQPEPPPEALKNTYKN